MDRLSVFFTIFIVIVFIMIAIYIFYDSSPNTPCSCRGSFKNEGHVKYSDDVKALVLTCMDFRLLDDIVIHMNSEGYRNDYDQFILAGASLGVNLNQSENPRWITTFRDHVDLAIDLHNISEVHVIDHMDCGAYKLFYDKESFTRDDEITLHKMNLELLKLKLNTLYPKLTVKLFLMDLDGTMIISN